MQRETVERANEIIRSINYNKRAICILSKLEGDTIALYDKKLFGNILTADTDPNEIIFKRSEIEMIIENKEKLIENLEKELEEL